MNINARLAELKTMKTQNKSMQKIGMIAGVILYASMFIAVFESHRLLALCVTCCLALCMRFLLRMRDLQVEERVLSRLNDTSPKMVSPSN